MPKSPSLNTKLAAGAIKVQAENNRLKDEISRLQYFIHHHVMRWIPCSEQMPKHFPCNYLVAGGKAWVRSCEGWLSKDGKLWRTTLGQPLIDQPTHWMPLPLPPDTMPKTPEFDVEALLKRIQELESFTHSFLEPEGYGFAVTEEVRNHARRLFGIPPVPTQGGYTGLGSGKLK